MTIDNVRKKTREVEEQQDDYRRGKNFLEEKREIFYQLFQQERHQNDDLLGDYHDTEDHYFYEEILSDCHQNEQQFFHSLEDHLAEVRKKESSLEDEREVLLNEERRLLRGDDSNG